VDDARLGVQAFNKAGWSPRRTRQVPVALAQHDIIAIDRIKATVEHLEDRLSRGFVVREGAQQFSAGRDGFGQLPARQ
jgi:hypothetical protein